MSDTATRIAGISDDQLQSLHTVLDTGDASDPAAVEAHHLVTVEMLKRGIPTGHTADEWTAATIEVEKAAVTGPDDIDMPGGLDEALGAAIAEGGTVTILLTHEGYVLKADPGVGAVHEDAIMGGKRKKKRLPSPLVDDLEKNADLVDYDDPDLLESFTTDDLNWFATVAAVLDVDGDPDLVVEKGNPEPLRDYWRGGGKGKINWGAGGDFTACAAAVSKYMSSEEAKGYCAIRHREVTGMWPGDKRNRAHKAASMPAATFTLPDGTSFTYTLSNGVGASEPVMKHPGHADQKVHGGKSPAGVERISLPKGMRGELKQTLNRGQQAEAYGPEFRRGRLHAKGQNEHGEPERWRVSSTGTGRNEVSNAIGRRDSAIEAFRATAPGIGPARETLAFSIVREQGFIDGATGSKPQFARSHNLGETLAGFVFGGLSGAEKSAEPVEKHPGHPDQKVHAGRGGGSDATGGQDAGGESYKGYALKAPDNPPGEVGKRRPESIAAAREARAKIAASEPAITRDMIDAADAHGGKMAGLDFRVKSEKSLARKVDEEKDLDFGGDAKKAADSMSDVVRYTVTFKDDSYVQGTRDVLRDLESKGYQMRVKNYWADGDPYQGINVAAIHPNGTRFELQFHTPTSLDFKEPIHVRYEHYRETKDTRVRYKEYSGMRRSAKDIPKPPPPTALLGIGEVKYQPFTTGSGQVVNL